MANVEVKVGGAWAAFDQQQEEQKAVINELCCQLSSLQTSHEQLSHKYDQLQVRHDRLSEVNVQQENTLQSIGRQLAESEGNLETTSFLKQESELAKQEELDHLTQKMQSLQDAAACADTAHQQQMDAMQKQVAELRDIIECSIHTKRASTLKLETAMTALNLSKPDAKRFVEELHAVKGKVEQLTGDRDKACLESVIVRQQRDCHADHAQLLVKENKRLLGQLQAMKLQQAQMSLAAAQQEAKLSSKGSAKHPDIVNASEQEQQAQPVYKERSIQRADRNFCGQNVQNVLHDKPFDLSQKVKPKQRTTAQAVLQQAQQIRAAKRRTC